LIALACHVKKMGLLVGLQTNGLYPEVLDYLIQNNLVDRIALDFKTSWESYLQKNEGYPVPLKKTYPENAMKSVKICARAFRNKELMEFQVVFTVFDGNEDEIIKIAKTIGNSDIVIQQGEYKLGVLDPESRKLVDGKYVSQKISLRKSIPPLSLEDLKRLANRIGKKVRIRVRGCGELEYFMKVIGVVGLPASGKGEFSRIAAGMGIPVIVMGDMIRREVQKAGLEPNDTNFGATANKLRAERGMDAIAQLCVPEIQAQTTPLVLVDGIRGDTEVTLFRKNFSGFTLIRIDSSFEKRLARITARARSDDFTTADALQNRDSRELGWGLGNAMRIADLTINNEGTLEEFAREVQTLLKEQGQKS
jgi:dephospho-CoA kinase